ncbi:hypothetical protein ACFW91_25070 [Streptomyces asoensis]|uniref:hypothetical protein n=1 Tax=Streptomyces asoensis TaxID=249586 RepID=UPI00367C2FE6
MTRHLLRQYTAALGALALAAAGAVCIWRGQLGPAAMAGLTVLCLTDIALRAGRRHQRLLEEHEWARRRGAGENPAPLWPCCLLASSSRGRAHSHRCTAPPLHRTDKE